MCVCTSVYFLFSRSRLKSELGVGDVFLNVFYIWM